MKVRIAVFEVRLEVLLADQRQNGALEADHRADEGVDPDEQRELARVRAQAELNVAHADWSARPLRFAATISAWPGGRGGKILEERRHERVLALVLQRFVVVALEADRGERVARQPATADGAADVARVDDHAVIELQELAQPRRRARARAASDRLSRASPGGRHHRPAASHR